MTRRTCSSKKSGWRNERRVGAGPYHRPPSARQSARKDRACIGLIAHSPHDHLAFLLGVSGASPWEGGAKHGGTRRNPPRHTPQTPLISFQALHMSYAFSLSSEQEHSSNYT